ncbi:MAG: membrane protein insertase YidC [Betaproteobacteria bacterium]|nr:membrane protein insertase YidC [Betaproteobacteria bacterium]
MEQRRLIPLVIFVLSLVMLWTNWVEYNKPAATAPHAAAPSAVSTPESQAPDDSVPAPARAATLPTMAPAPSAAPRVKVETDLIRAEISAKGGSIVRLELVKHRSSENPKENGYVILDDGAAHVFEAQSGLRIVDKEGHLKLSGDLNLPDHVYTMFELPDGNQTLADDQNKLVVRLKAPVVDGVSVTKVMTFTRGSYLIDVAYEIHNENTVPLAMYAYYQFLRDGKPAEKTSGGLFGGIRTFIGPAFYTDEGKFQKVSFGDIDENKAKFTANADNGWVAIVQHYFVSAWLPPQKEVRQYFTNKINRGSYTGHYTAGAVLDPVTVEPGATAQVGARLYVGPQDQHKLEEIAPGLKLVVDYGILTVIAAPLFWLLSWLHSLTGNWGWSIILVTVIVKAIFFPLSAASYKSMAKMRMLAPRMQRMKELYGDDKPKMQQEMMNLYRTEKINPLGGCLPIVVQIPVFLALYWVLLGSVEMRQAPWLGWIQDLSARDPYFILPLIMGASMLVQFKLNPSPPDPMQAKIMMVMPIIFTVMFLWFPSGLVLYWTVNNLLSIGQQWQITRMTERGGKKTAKPANDPKI